MVRDTRIISFMKDRFDPDKNAINQAKHNLSLAFGDRIFQGSSHLILPTVRAEDKEERFKLTGMVEDKLFTAIFVWRGEKPRFISVRRSNKREERSYCDPC